LTPLSKANSMGDSHPTRSRSPFEVLQRTHRRREYWRDTWHAWFSNAPRLVVALPAHPMDAPSSQKFELNHPRDGLYVLGMRFRRKLPQPVTTYNIGGRFLATFASDRGTLTLALGSDPMPFWSNEWSGFYWAVYDVGREVGRLTSVQLDILNRPALEALGLDTPSWFIAHWVRK
jgi:hypothetical protein